MILNEPAAIEKVLVNGRTTFDFRIFRISAKHVVGMYDEVNSFVSFIKDAAEGGSSREMAFVLVGEPGNGKTFFVDNLCALYGQFLACPENRKYTFNYVHLDKLGGYGKIKTIQSQTFEDPVILAMNLFESRDESKEFLTELGDFPDQQIDLLYRSYRPLGACSDYIVNDIRNYCQGDREKLLSFFEVVPVPLKRSMRPSPEVLGQRQDNLLGGGPAGRGIRPAAPAHSGREQSFTVRSQTRGAGACGGRGN